MENQSNKAILERLILQDFIYEKTIINLGLKGLSGWILSMRSLTTPIVGKGLREIYVQIIPPPGKFY